MKPPKYILFVLLLSGCAHLESASYPDSWPPPASVTTGTCPNVSGEYGVEQPNPSYGSQEERALRILHEVAGFQRILPVPNRVAISNNGNKIVRIQAYVENKLEREREFTSANATIRCESRGLFLEPPPLEQKIDGMGQTITRQVVFNIAVDGSLVFREEYTAKSGPMSGSGIRWNRLFRIGR